jgi:hypothetical protein
VQTVTIPERLVAGMYIKPVLDGINGNPQLLRWRQTTAGAFVVLTTWRGGEYATWLVGEYGAVEGHYFGTLTDARDDFGNRS